MPRTKNQPSAAKAATPAHHKQHALRKPRPCQPRTGIVSTSRETSIYTIFPFVISDLRGGPVLTLIANHEDFQRTEGGESVVVDMTRHSVSKSAARLSRNDSSPPGDWGNRWEMQACLCRRAHLHTRIDGITKQTVVIHSLLRGLQYDETRSALAKIFVRTTNNNIG